MAKDWGFTPVIEERRKFYGIRGDRLKTFLEKCGAKDEAEAINAIDEKYRDNTVQPIEGKSEETAETLTTDETDRTDGEPATISEPDTVSDTSEAATDSHEGECNADSENSDDAVPERANVPAGDTRTVSEKLYIHRTNLSVDHIVHPVTGLPL